MRLQKFLTTNKRKKFSSIKTMNERNKDDSFLH